MGGLRSPFFDLFKKRGKKWIEIIKKRGKSKDAEIGFSIYNVDTPVIPFLAVKN